MTDHHVLITGPPAFGRSALLASLFRTAVGPRGAGLWVDGSSVANEDHLVAQLTGCMRPGRALLKSWRAEWDRLIEDVRAWSAEDGGQRTVVLAIDDLDDLVFKRAELAIRLSRALAAVPQIRLIGSSGLAGHRRVLRKGEPLHGLFQVKVLGRLTEDESFALLERRFPGLPSEVADWISEASGGHPAAVVYLGRMASMSLPSSPEGLLESAATMAGAVYAEPWATLGPQQRAILTELARQSARPCASPHLASALALQQSHLNAQLSRLVDEGLVWRPSRGHYQISALLSRWIVRRAVRGWTTPETIADNEVGVVSFLSPEGAPSLRMEAV